MFLVLEHKSNSFSDSAKQDHMIQLDHSESYKEAASNIDELLAPIPLSTSNHALNISSLNLLKNLIEDGTISRIENFSQASINLKSFIELLSRSIFLRL